MTKSLLIILVVLLTSIGASNASADSSTVTFQCTGTCDSIPIATNNPVSFPFPTIDVRWEGIEFDLTFNNPGEAASDTYIWNGFLNDYQPFPGNPTYPVELIFIIFDSDTMNFAMSRFNGAFEGAVRPEVADAGTVAFTPEPSSLALMLAGVWLVFVMRKRIGQGLPQAS
jgi:hypothetical protein